MSPILTGVIASGISGHLTPPWSPEGAYDALASVTVPSGGASSITFAGIPNTYKHLQIRAIAKAVSNEQGYFMQFNSDTGTNYNTHLLYGNGASVTALSNNTWAGLDIASTSSSNFSAIVVDILDYTDTNKNTTIRSLSGVDNNGSGYATPSKRSLAQHRSSYIINH